MSASLPSQSGTPIVTLADDVLPVVEGGFCVGCGACAVRAPQALKMERDRGGAMQAKIINAEKLAEAVGGVCPFSDNGPNENAHALNVFGADIPSDPHLGRVRGAFAGHAAEAGFREEGSSGGVTSWILTAALRRGVIDAVIHVHPAEGDDLFAYEVSRSEADLKRGAKTRYYSVSLDEAMRTAIAEKRRIAVVGVPCFIKAVRNLAASDEAINQAVVLTAAIFCGHMKAAGFAETLAWQLGIAPPDVQAVDFRVKRAGLSAKRYGFSALAKRTGKTVAAPMEKLAGRGWDGGYFRLKACDFCDDVVGETADISMGDAWLPEFDRDSGGTNVIVARSKLAIDLIEEGRRSGGLAIQDLAAERVVASQSAGFRDRREALAYRLLLADRRGGWRPKKRVEPRRDHIPAVRKVIYRLRAVVRRRSFSSLRLCKAVGAIWPYRVEMAFWHIALRVIAKTEVHLRRLRK